MIAVTVLSGCSNFEMKQPATVIFPSTTKVTVVGNPSLSNVTVTVDGTTVNSQLAYTGSATAEGNLSLAIGMHTLTAAADVSCWYCSGRQYHPTDTKMACVINPNPNTTAIPAIKIPFAKTDNKSWTDGGGANLSLGADSGTNATRWQFLRLGGFASSTGAIESIAEFPCMCLRALEDNTGVALAACDFNDVRQQWNGLKQQTASGGKGLYSFAAQNGVQFCLTESGNNLVQSGCTISDNQLWALQNIALGRFESDQTAWGQ